jgi:hypothetical protein
MPNPNIFKSNYGTKINIKGLNSKQVNKIQNLANNKYGDRAAKLASQWQTRIPKATTPPPTGGGVTQGVTNQPGPGNPALATQQPAATPAPAAPSQDVANNLFPSERMFEPKNYQGSPLYQFQVQQGQKQLGRSLAARGLTNSGKGIEEELNIPMMAAAQDTDRMSRVAENNANRLQTMQENEAMRRERAGNTQWDRQFSLAELMARESPWAASLEGLGAYGDNTKAAGSAYADYLRNAFTRAIGGGGGGAGFTPTQLPSGPDYSMIDLAGINSKGNSSTNWLNIIGQGLGSFFK